MGQRELKDTVEQQYFEPAAVPVSEDEGTRDMKVLYPFLISGGPIQNVGILYISMTLLNSNST